MAKSYEDYEKTGLFNEEQLYQIKRGLIEGLDVSFYADPKKGAYVMEYERGYLEDMAAKNGKMDAGLVNKLVEEYPHFKAGEIEELYWASKEGLDISKYAVNGLTAHRYLTSISCFRCEKQRKMA